MVNEMLVDGKSQLEGALRMHKRNKAGGGGCHSEPPGGQVCL